MEARSVNQYVRDMSVARRATAMYAEFARSIETEANDLPKVMGLTARTVKHKATIARKAARAERDNPEPPERPLDRCKACAEGKCDRCPVCVDRILEAFR